MVHEACAARVKLRLGEAVEHAVNQVAVGGRAFGIGDPMTIGIVGHKVGEGAADVDGNGIGHFLASRSLFGSHQSINCGPRSIGAHASHSTLIMVSTVAQRLASTCIRMVSVVEPLRQRTSPNRSPMKNTCRMPNQSYWM